MVESIDFRVISGSLCYSIYEFIRVVYVQCVDIPIHGLTFQSVASQTVYGFHDFVRFL